MRSSDGEGRSIRSDALYPALSGEWEVPVTRNAKIHNFKFASGPKTMISSANWAWAYCPNGWPGAPNPNYICRSRSQARWQREFQRDTARFSQKLLARNSPECVAVFRLRGGWVSGLRMRLGHIWFSTLHYPRQADREGRAFTRLAYD
jgi:hypothetical protein